MHRPPAPRPPAPRPPAPRPVVAPFVSPVVAPRLAAAALVLAALASACDRDPPATPAPTPRPTPAPTPTPPPGLAAPANLTASAAGPDFIEYRWDAVPGATAYEAQLSRVAGSFASVTSVETAATSHRFPAPPGTVGYARVRALARGGLRSPWSPTAQGATRPAPPTLATPLPYLSDSGPDYLVWAWSPIPDALVYRVQVAATPEALTAAAVIATAAPTHRAAVPPQTTAYLRVRAAAGGAASPVLSEWSAPVAGTTPADAPKLEVRLALPARTADPDCSGQVFCPDDETDPRRATARVNPALTITTSAPARMAPEFDDDAPPLDLRSGTGAPFAHTAWRALQTEVARNGVTFSLTRLTTEPGPAAEPTEDTLYLTCGPFRCSEPTDEPPPAPRLAAADSPACAAFDADFELEAGLVMNDGQDRVNGLDAGWTYTATAPAALTHEFSTLAGSRGPLEVRGPEVPAARRETPLDLTRDDETRIQVFGGRLETDEDIWSAYGTENLTQTTAGPVRNGDHDCFFLTAEEVRTGEAEPGRPYLAPGGGAHQNAWLTDTGSYDIPGADRIQKPRHCFRIVTDDTSGQRGKGLAGRRARGESRADHLAGYTLRVEPKVAALWAGSRVEWPTGRDPFAEAECASLSFPAADQVDMCDLFEEEVDRFWGDGSIADLGPSRYDGAPGAAEDAFGSGRQRFRLRALVDGGRLAALQLARNLEPLPDLTGAAVTEVEEMYRNLPRPTGSRFFRLHLREAGSGPEVDRTRADRDLYYPSPDHAGTDSVGREDSWWIWGDRVSFPRLSWVESAGRRVWPQRALLTIPVLDDDLDPAYRDFGKVDLDRGGDGNGRADNFTGSHSRCTISDGRGCDADEVVLEGEFTLSLYKESDACLQTVEVSLTCSWDAQGRDGDADADPASGLDPGNAHRFLRCRKT